MSSVLQAMCHEISDDLDLTTMAHTPLFTQHCAGFNKQRQSVQTLPANNREHELRRRKTAAEKKKVCAQVGTDGPPHLGLHSQLIRGRQMSSVTGSRFPQRSISCIMESKQDPGE